MGQAKDLSDDERQEILKLAEQYEWSVTKIAQELGRSPSCISKYLLLFKSTEKVAKRYLETQALPAAMAWGKALTVAAADGNHKPARDLLAALDVIKPLGGGGLGTSKLIVVVGVGQQHACTIPDQTLIDAECAVQHPELEHERMDECLDLAAFDD